MPQPVAVKGTGVYVDVGQQVDQTHRAARVSLRPQDVGVYGSYRIGLASGVMAAGLAAGAPIFSFRWSTNNTIALIQRVRITANTDGTAFAQGSTIFDIIRATQFAVQDTGGAVISLKGKDQALATRFAPSGQQIAAVATGSIAVAGTATLTAGTRTLDTNPLSVLIGGAGANPAISLVPFPGLLLDPADASAQMLELSSNEGFVIRATVPATGTWKFGVDVAWLELDPARYF